ncbi:MAG TPA: hypothetical protein VIE43_16755 [Thermoanaerobaculia bacterium]|nr:hypothetical protein [Thermoanaerobaculia bacterium]
MSDTNSFPRTLRIGILVFDGFEPIDVWGFVEAFSLSRFIGTGYFGDPPYPFEWCSSPINAGRRQQERRRHR